MGYLELLTGPISSLGVPYKETSSLLWVENLTLLSGISGWLGEDTYPSDMPCSKSLIYNPDHPQNDTDLVLEQVSRLLAPRPLYARLTAAQSE